MKRFYSLVIFLLLCFLYASVNGQKLYDDAHPLAETQGKRLMIMSSTNPTYPSDFFSYEYEDTNAHKFSFNLYGDYRRWKFSEKLLVGGYIQTGMDYSNSKGPITLTTSETVKQTDYSLSAYGGASYYLTPNKIYVTGAIGGQYVYQKIDNEVRTQYNIDSSRFPVYLWGALGYGRVNNRQVVEASYDFNEALRSRGIISSKLDDKTLLKISELLYRHRNGEYLDKYEDDQNVKLFSDIEKTLLNAGYINCNLDAGSTVKLYEILNNTNKKYIFYPKYSGYQAQVQLQYMAKSDSRDDAHDHFLSASGVYCFNPSEKSNLVLSGYFAIPLDTMTNGLGADFANYLAFLPDANNLAFFKQFSGTGFYGGRYVVGLQAFTGLRADYSYSISSTAGVQASLYLINKKFKYADAHMEYQIAGRFDYNIISSLVTYAKLEILKESSALASVPTRFTTSIGFSYRIF